jgi:hypothetical protein
MSFLLLGPFVLFVFGGLLWLAPIVFMAFAAGYDGPWLLVPLGCLLLAWVMGMAVDVIAY